MSKLYPFGKARVKWYPGFEFRVSPASGYSAWWESWYLPLRALDPLEFRTVYRYAFVLGYPKEQVFDAVTDFGKYSEIFHPCRNSTLYKIENLPAVKKEDPEILMHADLEWHNDEYNTEIKVFKERRQTLLEGFNRKGSSIFQCWEVNDGDYDDARRTQTSYIRFMAGYFHPPCPMVPNFYRWPQGHTRMQVAHQFELEKMIRDLQAHLKKLHGAPSQHKEMLTEDEVIGKTIIQIPPIKELEDRFNKHPHYHDMQYYGWAEWSKHADPTPEEDMTRATHELGPPKAGYDARKHS